MSSNAPLYNEVRPDHLPPWAPGRCFCFLSPLWGDRVFLPDRSEKFAAPVFLVEAAGLRAVAPAKVDPDSALRLTIEIELELTDLFTEVIESI